MTTVKLLKLNHIDNTYNNLMDFTNVTNRDNYFNSKVEHTFDLNLKDDTNLETITIPTNHTNIDYCNYLFITDEKNKKLFYFIISFEHKTPTHTILNIQLDCFTTYQFDFKLLPSFVERCHVPRWNGNIPTKNTIDEGIPLGEYILDSTSNICSYNDGLIIASTQPLGKCGGFHNPNTPSDGGGSTGEPTSDGYPSTAGVRYIKGREGFTPVGAYLNNESFKTVGYGSTHEGSHYYDMHLPSPCTEKLATEILCLRMRENFGSSLYAQLEADGIINKITLNRFDAMASLCYNVGFGGFTEYPSSPYHIIKTNPDNLSQIRTVWEAFALTNENGEFLQGLADRRKEESNIYCNNDYGKIRPISIIDKNGDYVGTVTDNRGDGYMPEYLPVLNPQIIIEIIEEV